MYLSHGYYDCTTETYSDCQPNFLRNCCNLISTYQPQLTWLPFIGLALVALTFIGEIASWLLVLGIVYLLFKGLLCIF